MYSFRGGRSGELSTVANQGRVHCVALPIRNSINVQNASFASSLIVNSVYTCLAADQDVATGVCYWEKKEN